MKLYVVRHSIREPSDDYAEGEEGDPEAELTDDGKEIASAMGRWMAQQGEVPSKFVVSPTVRAQQTAELICEELEEAGFDAPEIEVDASISPGQSIRGLLLKLSADESQKGVGIVTHRESIVRGLKALNVDNGDDSKVDDPAMGELRVIKVKRKSGKWEEKKRVRPSDLGLADQYS